MHEKMNSYKENEIRVFGFTMKNNPKNDFRCLIMMIVEKNLTPYSSMMVVLINGVCLWKSGWGNLVLSETGRTRIRNDLVLIIISSWANCTINITVSTLGITPRFVIDKIDGNHCQRQLDQSGQTTRYQKQL